MKTVEEIKSELEKILSDERLQYPPANVLVNAPLALIQVELKARAAALAWVLEQTVSPN